MTATTRCSLLLSLALTAAVPGGAAPLGVTVSILPQRAVVERIGGTEVRVTVLVEPGQSPATYEPTPRQMAALSSADLWITVGVPFEASALRAARSVAPRVRVIDGARGIDLMPMSGADAAHPDAAGDPHFWLDPALLAIHARTVRDALAELAPRRAGAFDANLAALERDLDGADQRARNLLAPLVGRDLVVFHPAFGYLCRRYGLLQRAVEVEGREPSSRQLAGLVERARAAHAPALFVQPQFASRSVAAVAEALGVPVIELDPLAPDPVANLETMAAAIAAAYRSRP